MSDIVDFFDALLRYEIDLWNHLDRAIQTEHGLTLGRLQALQVVRRHDGNARVNEVSSELGITVGAASKLVDRLEDDGLASRAPNPADRRSSLISLTPVGASVVAAATGTFRTELSRVLPSDTIGRDELGALTAALSRLNGQLPAPARTSEPGSR